MLESRIPDTLEALLILIPRHVIPDSGAMIPDPTPFFAVDPWSHIPRYDPDLRRKLLHSRKAYFKVRINLSQQPNLTSKVLILDFLIAFVDKSSPSVWFLDDLHWAVEDLELATRNVVDVYAGKSCSAAYPDAPSGPQSSLQKQPFLLALRRWAGSFARRNYSLRNVLSSKRPRRNGCFRRLVRKVDLNLLVLQRGNLLMLHAELPLVLTVPS